MQSDIEILNLLKRRVLIIKPFYKKTLGCASIDLSLSKHFVKYTKNVDTRAKEVKTTLTNKSKITLKPNQFVLATTHENVQLKNGYYGFIEARGNFARAGISVTCGDGHIDPGTNGQITLEIKNNNSVDVSLYAGDYICQLFIFKLSSNCSKVYAGKYSKQKLPTQFIR